MMTNSAFWIGLFVILAMFSRMAVLKMVRIPLRSTPLFRILANQMEKIIFTWMLQSAY